MSKKETEKIENTPQQWKEFSKGISKEDLQRTKDRLYSCRDLEINNLWQRTAFLGTFIILAFTGYGVIAFNIASPSKDAHAFSSDNLHLVAIGICVLGFIMSYLWTMMNKSSKAWYEVYETAITCFERDCYKELGIPFHLRMGKMKPKEINNFIFSSKAGAYSPSKINIVLGQICLIIWAVLLLGHLNEIQDEKILSLNPIRQGKWLLGLGITFIVSSISYNYILDKLSSWMSKKLWLKNKPILCANITISIILTTISLMLSWFFSDIEIVISVTFGVLVTILLFYMNYQSASGFLDDYQKIDHRDLEDTARAERMQPLDITKNDCKIKLEVTNMEEIQKHIEDKIESMVSNIKEAMKATAPNPQDGK